MSGGAGGDGRPRRSRPASPDPPERSWPVRRGPEFRSGRHTSTPSTAQTDVGTRGLCAVRAPWVVAAALVLAGCSAGGEPAPPPALPTASSPASASTAPTASPTVPPTDGPASAPVPTGPAVLEGVTVTYHPDGSVAGLRLVTPAALTELVADDPPGVRTRYVGWDRCAPGCGISGAYDVETRRLLAQALPGRYPVPAGAPLLVLAVRVDGPAPAACLAVPALRATAADGTVRRLTAPDGGPVVTVCPEG